MFNPGFSTNKSTELIRRETYDIDIRVDDGCGNTSSTSVNKKVCKGAVLFKELFTQLDTSVWKQRIKMASQPDYEFVTYVSSDQITYIQNGTLHIKPQVKDADYISGHLALENCTGHHGTRECEKSAYSFDIIPPVLSGYISTKHSFSFRYGKVQIKAKLPLGDWIVPEIRLLPKENSYGDDYLSGVIRLGMARGNKNLRCDSLDLGNHYLEVGIYIGEPNKVKSKVFTKYIPDHGWYHNYHNFTIVWTPDNLSFIVDNETLGSILSTGDKSVVEVTGQPEDVANIWNDGSKMAPFDRDFYINLGVSVGGVKDFPDNCFSNGKKKPWSNTSPKAMLHFWQANDDWKNTWSDDKSLLKVEHVRVTAL